MDAQTILPVLLPNKYQASENKNRDLSNVSFSQQELLEAISGSHKAQNPEDFDMLYETLIQSKFKACLESYKLSDLRTITNDQISYQYNLLDEVYQNSPQVHKQIDFDYQHSARDRYSDIVTYLKTQVKLIRGVKPDSIDGYINACFINSPFSFLNNSQFGDKKIIASQGPLPQTTDHFWQMIVEQNVTMIISTCRTEEQGRKKCNPFWPGNQTGQVKNFQITQDPSAPLDVKVTLIEEIEDSQHLLRREMVAEYEGQTQNVTQIHFMGWPDHGVPEGKAVQDFETMLNYFIEWTLKSAGNEKAIVHCSAGIGRTGTTISLMEQQILLAAQKNAGIKDPSLCLFSTVRRLREQRFGSVQTKSQYEFMFQFLKSKIR